MVALVIYSGVKHSLFSPLFVEQHSKTLFVFSQNVSSTSRVHSVTECACGHQRVGSLEILIRPVSNKYTFMYLLLSKNGVFGK